MRVLVACEESQAVTIAFRELGHQAFSCDIQACSGGYSEWHIGLLHTMKHSDSATKRGEEEATHGY